MTRFFSRIAVSLTAALAAAGPLFAAIAVYVPPEELARSSPLVVEGVVEQVASGYDPRSGGLATYVTLEIETVHRGPADLDRVVLRELGGRFGNVVHEVDAVPAYRTGGRVLVFLEAAADGALQTRAMFFGYFEIEEPASRGPRMAVRDLGALGSIRAQRAPRREALPLRDLVSLAQTVPYVPRRRGAVTGSRAARSTTGPGWSATPPELDRLRWEERGDSPLPAAGVLSAGTATLQQRNSTSNESRFAPLSLSNPTRWGQLDSGVPLQVHVQPSGNPLGDDAAAVEAIRRAAEAWTGVPESRLTLNLGNPAYDYTGTHAISPADGYTGTNVVLFDDPYGDISDPSGCSGVLAVGGYWRTGAVGSTVQNVPFYPALQLYVIFNNGFECFLDDPDNLAEVAAHELGHGVGFGHSTAPDSIMRSAAYGNRGARLGEDDRDAAHCTYPHALQLTSPNGGESWETGGIAWAQWSQTAEDGTDAGRVDLEYSADGGASWATLAAAVRNDGQHAFLVPQQSSGSVRVRVVRHNLGEATWAAFPASCSGDTSDGLLAIVEPPVSAGSIPTAGLSLERGPGAELRLVWDSSCSSDAEDYVVYEGNLESLRLGVWDHAPRSCAAGPDLTEYLLPGTGNRYFLVAPTAGGFEGGLGHPAGPGMSGPRPASAAACLPRDDAPTCP